MHANHYFLGLCIYALWCLFTWINGCRLTYTSEPFVDNKCVPRTLSSLEIWHSSDLQQCQWRCLKMEECDFLNYNTTSGQCELGFSQCISLWSALGVWVNVYGPSRHVCLHWGSNKPTGLIPIKVHNEFSGMYVARIVIGQALVVGKLTNNMHWIYVNNGDTAMKLQYDATLGHELLMADPNCTLSWVQYTPHSKIPSGAVIGGHLVDGSPTYVVKVHHVRHGKSYAVPGYYSMKTGMAHAEFYGPQASTDMKILILL